MHEKVNFFDKVISWNIKKEQLLNLKQTSAQEVKKKNKNKKK